MFRYKKIEIIRKLSVLCLFLLMSIFLAGCGKNSVSVDMGDAEVSAKEISNFKTKIDGRRWDNSLKAMKPASGEDSYIKCTDINSDGEVQIELKNAWINGYVSGDGYVEEIVCTSNGKIKTSSKNFWMLTICYTKEGSSKLGAEYTKTLSSNYEGTCLTMNTVKYKS